VAIDGGMARPKVCIVALHSYGYFADEYGLTGGGAERQLSLLAAELADSFDVHVLVADYGQAEREVRDGVTLHRTYAPHDDPSVTDRADWLWKLARTMNRVDADIYVHRGTPSFAAIVATLTDLLGKPWVYNVANDANITERPERLGTVRETLFRRGVGRATAVVAQTPKQAKMIRETWDRDPEIIPNGYPAADHTTPYDDREYVLWVGRLAEDQKRPHLFLDLAARLPETEFRMVGPAGDDTSYQRRLERRIGELDNVSYPGPVRPDAIHDQYREAMGVVSTSAYEGFPNTFLEAWRVGTPVLSLDVDPGRIAGVDAVDGYADGDFDSLVNATAELAGDAAVRREHGEAVRDVFEDRFQIEEVARQFGSVLRSNMHYTA
jgi:glycosyltransferase involved in cell wall biosynthesis